MNYPLFDERGIRPNDEKKWLFTTDDPDHALQFSMGQTTSGDVSAFEVYDENVDDLYDAEENAGEILEFFDEEKDSNMDEELAKWWLSKIHAEGDVEQFERWMRSMGKEGFVSRDVVVAQDPDDYPGRTRQVSTAHEYVFFDKKTPIERFKKDASGFWSKEDRKRIQDYGAESLWDEDYEENMPEDPDAEMTYRQWEEDDEKRQAEIDRIEEYNEYIRDEKRSGQEYLFGDIDEIDVDDRYG
jgi:hypothetical protein